MTEKRGNTKQFKGAQGLRSLKTPKSGRVLYKDAGQSGLYVWVSHTGKRAWLCQVKVKGETKARQKTIGYWHPDSEGATTKPEDLLTLTDARTAAIEALELAQAGLDPFPVEDAKRFPAVWDLFMQRYFRDKGPRTQEFYETLRRRIGKRWDSKRVDSIEKADINRLLDVIGDITAADKRARGGLSAANNAFACLRTFFRWCWQRGVVTESP
ncbi:MAG: integrase family protein, partial [Gammaproteobacteria bacterium]|nr:integrase family protein [Gammaproteobacteria bacterium]